MKVLYDFQIFAMQKFGGISRYFFELLKNHHDHDVHAHVSAEYHKNSYLSVKKKPLEIKQSLGYFGSRPFPGRGLMARAVDIFRRPKNPYLENMHDTIFHLTNGNYDIFHPTYYDNYFLDYLGNTKFVLTVYDMIHEIYPEMMSLTDMTLNRKANLVNKADHIITISNQTKYDIINFYAIPEKRITVIYLAGNLSPGNIDYDRVKDIPARYILYVGNRRSYKNFYFMILSLSKILKEDSSLHLICTGIPFYQKEIDFFKKLHINSKQIMHICADDALLHYLYSRAIFFVFPSLYEGFGIPVLESFACGCPAVISNIPAFREIAGDAAYYIDPKSVSDIRQACKVMIENKNERKKYIIKGYERAKMYSWNITVRKTFECYKSMLS